METRIFKGTVQYFAQCRGVLFSEPIIFDIQHPSIERVCLESKEADKIILIFSIINEQSLEKACEIANYFSDKILNRIAFTFNAIIGIPRLYSGTIVEEITLEDGMKSVIIHPSTITSRVTVSADLKITPPPSDKIKILLDGLPYEDNLKDHYYSEYRFILLNNDPIAVFMSLYNILLQVLGDDQKFVDEFIRQEEPSVQEFPDRQGKQTLYTKLRNDVGHPKKRPLKETNEEIKAVLEKFKMFVRKAIEEKI